MIKVIDKNLEKIICFMVIIIMIGLPLLKLPVYLPFLGQNIIKKIALNPVYVLWVMLPLLLIVYLYGLIKKTNKINFFDIIMYILIIAGIISTIKAVDINTSIYGEIYRNEGLLSLLSYYLIFLNVKNLKTEKLKKNLVKIYMILAIIQTSYAILQVYTNFTFIKHFSKSYMAMGLCGNPNFYGSYIIMPLIISLVLYLLKKQKKYLLLSIFFFIGLCLASSTGPFLGFLIAIIFFVIVFHRKIKFPIIITTLLIFTSLYFGINSSVKYIQENRFNNKISRKYNITAEIVDTVKKKNLSQNSRIKLWEKTLPLINDYGLYGAGIDNFAKVYPQSPGIIYDKAHNIYLQIFVTNGIFAIIPYLTLCLILFFVGLKFQKNFMIALYISFIAYSIQAFTNISVIDVAPFFYILLGILCSNINLSSDILE